MLDAAGSSEPNGGMERRFRGRCELGFCEYNLHIDAREKVRRQKFDSHPSRYRESV